LVGYRDEECRLRLTGQFTCDIAYTVGFYESLRNGLYVHVDPRVLILEL
jgi:hypothetical protein